MKLRILFMLSLINTVSADTLMFSDKGELEVIADHNAVGETYYRGLIEESAKRYRIPPKLLLELVRSESDFNPDARSAKGALGLGQLMPATARALGVTNALAPTENLNAAARYLRQLLDKFDGDQACALAAYNAGPGAVVHHKGVPPYEETQRFVKQIMARVDPDWTLTPTAPAPDAAPVVTLETSLSLTPTIARRRLPAPEDKITARARRLGEQLTETLNGRHPSLSRAGAKALAEGLVEGLTPTERRLLLITLDELADRHWELPSGGLGRDIAVVLGELTTLDRPSHPGELELADTYQP